MIAAIPITDAIATIATPKSSPHIIHKVLLIPMDMPSVIAKVIHIPGVRLTIKNVGMNKLNKVKSINEMSGLLLEEQSCILSKYGKHLQIKSTFSFPTKC